jgi:peptidoglycan-associated lipoprotein
MRSPERFRNLKEDAMGRWVGGSPLAVRFQPLSKDGCDVAGRALRFLAVAARFATALALALAITAGAGCGAKKKDLGADDYGTAGLGEEGLEGRGSLADARAGTLGAVTGPLDDIHFAFDSFDLDDEARVVLKRNADWLSQNRSARVEVEGHCDERGTVEYNLALGAKRAASARSYLVSLGISPERLSTISYGEELPLCHEPTEACWQRNRRVHFVVTSQ